MSFLPFQAWDDFDTYTIGTNLAGYTLRGGGAPTYKPQYSTTAILPYKRRYLEFLTDATTDYHAVSRDAVDADANRATFDIVFGFAVDLCTVEELHVYARGQGTSSMTDFLRASIVLATGAIRIDKMVGSAYTAGSGASAGTVTLTAGHAYFGRFRGSGGNISLKIWDASLGAFADRQFAGEPAAFNITPTGMTPTAAGWVAFGGRHSTLTGKVAAFNFEATATNGDVAVAPRTNAEYTAWLAKQDVLRAVVAKMRATGYDSSGSPYTKTVKAYIANHGYTSAQQDSPSLQHFDACITGLPTFSREMPAALSGQATVNIGKMRVANPRPSRVETLRAVQNLITGSSESIGSWQLQGGATRPTNQQFTTTGISDYIQKNIVAAASRRYVVSVDLSVTAGTATKSLRICDASDGSDATTVSCNLTTTPQRFTVTGDMTGTGTYSGTLAILIGNLGSGGAATVNINRIHLEDNTGLTITAPSDYVSLGVLSPPWQGYGADGLMKFTYANGNTVASNVVTEARGADLNSNQTGTRDDWLRIHWLRDGFEMLMGGPTWPLHDFRHLLRGRLGNPTAPDLRTIEFPIADMSEALAAPVQTQRYSSGDFNNMWIPRLFGDVRCLELQFDTASLVGYINSGALANSPSDANFRLFDCTATAFVHIGGTKNCGVSSVDTATETITASVAHNMSAGYRVQFVGAGTLPSPLNVNQDYWVLAAGLTATDFRLTDTYGSTTPVNLTSAGSGSRNFNSYGYTFSASAGTVTLVNPPAGRVFCFHPGKSPELYTVSSVVASIAFSALGISLNYKDAAAFAAAATVDDAQFMWTGIATHVNQNPSGLELLNRIASGCQAWFGFSPDGLMQTGAIALPAATAVASFDRSSIASIALTGTIRAIDFSAVQITCQPWFSIGPPPIVPGIRYTVSAYDYGETSAELAAGLVASAAASYSAGTPLDDRPSYYDATKIGAFNTLITYNGSLDTRWKTFFQNTLGVYEFSTTLAALQNANGPLSIGDTISVDFPRLGFKQWSASNPASPDNTATIDSRLCVVIGIAVNLDAKPTEKVRLKVFRRIPGYYPTSNLN